jgi:hypothetical protein
VLCSSSEEGVQLVRCACCVHRVGSETQHTVVQSKVYTTNAYACKHMLIVLLFQRRCYGAAAHM